MEPKKIALLVGAVVVALVTALLARQMFVKSATPVASAMPGVFVAPKGPKVLVATRALPVGTIIDDASFKYQPWPKELVQGAYFVEGGTDNINTLRGAVVRTAASAGQPLTRGSLVQPGDHGFLAAALTPGMRAVTIGAANGAGGVGFIFPGDRVDLMLTQSVESTGGGPALKASETIVRNLRVLATDQRTVSEDKDGKKEVKPFTNITIEVTPRMAEKIAVAQSLGQLSLSLRPLTDNTADLERAIAAGEINVPRGSDPKADKTLLLQVASRPSDTDTTYVTGADVSRFARRTIAPTATRSAMPLAPGLGAPAGQTPAPGVSFGAPPKGPVVRVTRGKDVTEVPIGGK